MQVIAPSLFLLHTNTHTCTLCLCWPGCQGSSQAWLKVMLVISCRQGKCTTPQLMWQTGRFPSSHMIQSRANYKQRVVSWQTSVILQVIQLHFVGNREWQSWNVLFINLWFVLYIKCQKLVKNARKFPRWCLQFACFVQQTVQRYSI